jgi:hypothetical protein
MIDPTEVNIIHKYLALRKAGFNRVVWNDCGVWYISYSTTPIPDWYAKQRVTVDQLTEILNNAEREITPKKPVARENRRTETVQSLCAE